uniref:Core-binding factor subunit beta n=1 Tax=Phallusia mammillata TaxID=59560 RepID=A0A6F9D902_9ASCI|nr:CBFB core-binding factor, b subunit [Phallusia mammillata]
MPKVVSDQRATYESNELFRRLSRETEIKYTGFRDRAVEERQLRFQSSCRSGKAEIAFVSSGTNFTLQFYPWTVENTQGIPPPKEYVNFEREPGKVHLKAPFILNGVCVCWKGWVSLHRLDGMGCIEYDDERAQVEAQQGNSMQQSMQSVTGPKHKHPSTGGGGGSSSPLDKRPRLH